MVTLLVVIWMCFYLHLYLAFTNDTFDLFMLVTEPMNFTIAEQYCFETFGTHLATILSISQILEARSICQESNVSCWIGLNDIQHEDSWFYTSGKIYEESVQDWYQMPGSRQPNGGSTQNCVMLWADYDHAWIDYICGYKSPFLCDAYTFSPTYQTISPSKSPVTTISPTPSPTITDRFILVTETMNFTDAEFYCQSQYGTHLATIHTQLDINQTKLLCASTGYGPLLIGCWIGLNRIQLENENEWVFTSGKRLDASDSVQDWYRNLLMVSTQYCAALWRYYDFAWNDYWCDRELKAFICDADTFSPTSQTISPTPFPSATPTTSVPTGDTVSPTSLPSVSPTSVTYSPSLSPNIIKNVEVGKDELDIKWIIITILSVCIIALVVLIIVVCTITRLRRKHKRIDGDDNEDDDDSDERIQFKNQEVENWLKDKCDLVRYLDNFVENGYDSIEMIANIENIQELEEIGIMLKGHQKMILSAIKQLQPQEGKSGAEGEHGTLKS